MFKIFVFIMKERDRKKNKTSIKMFVDKGQDFIRENWS
jgi:hypothetical protein